MLKNGAVSGQAPLIFIESRVGGQTFLLMQLVTAIIVDEALHVDCSEIEWNLILPQNFLDINGVKISASE